MPRAFTPAAVLLAAMAASPAGADLSLLMFDQPGCVYCARWDREIAPAYPKTEEGMAAPLRRLSLHEPLPDDVVIESRVTFTPTFVLLEDGAEVGRIEGYPGDAFFWPLLARLIESADRD